MFQSDDKLNQGDNSVDTDIIYKLSYFPYIKLEGLTLSLIFSNLKEIIFSVYQTSKRFTNEIICVLFRCVLMGTLG
jgi:hypothetical protein